VIDGYTIGAAVACLTCLLFAALTPRLYQDRKEKRGWVAVWLAWASCHALYLWRFYAP
jgi:hypothetical protein